MNDDKKNAISSIRAAAKDVPGPPAGAPGDRAGELDGGDGQDLSALILADNCPVVPLGHSGDVCYYLDQSKQLRPLKAEKHSRLSILKLFGDDSKFLYNNWPRWTPNPRVKGEFHITGWKPEEAAEALMGDCARRGIWSPDERQRGSGAWLGESGELIWHCGEVLIAVSANEPAVEGVAVPWEEKSPGLVGRYVYPGGKPLHLPHADRQAAGEKGPAAKLLSLFSTWHWKRPDVDPHLLLGWVGSAMIGGAINWRPMAWVTGDSGSGKSTLQQTIKWLMGDNGLLHSPDATAPAVRQVLKYNSLPVEIDEAESDADNRRINTLTKLARDAATGALAIRGGSDHEASSFTVRSCFLFTSILMPSMKTQDWNRFAVLELEPLEDKSEPKITQERMAALGRKLMRRLADNWHRWPATVDAYRQALRKAKHSARGQDVFGTLLAAADLLLYDEIPVEDALMAWGEKLAAESLAELDGLVAEQNGCLSHLLSSILESPHDRQRRTIGDWIGRAARRWETDADGADRANKLLQQAGCRVCQEDGATWFAVANKHRGLDRIFDQTQWAALPGAKGAWVQALRRLQHKPSKGSMYFGSTERATLLPIDICLPPRPPQGAASHGSAVGSGAAQDHGEAGPLGDAALERGGDADQTAVQPDLDPAGWELDQ